MILRECPDHDMPLVPFVDRLRCMRIVDTDECDGGCCGCCNAQHTVLCPYTEPLPPDQVMAASGAERLL